ncbi:hypothetical protein EQG49_01200 [Periweissella cryptocerci]|uniref:Uncharacterized protein n=1 Tax=Periweissella cryptocerci TaxID=2506420 RepID=A0A4P6YRC6_9LACO|nr:hypothetical protein [Periweissella cryptocerci]QBO35166.1 hypothetical protein EQG49_01200 [Periweissella cryptocerci]
MGKTLLIGLFLTVLSFLLMFVNVAIPVIFLTIFVLILLVISVFSLLKPMLWGQSVKFTKFAGVYDQYSFNVAVSSLEKILFIILVSSSVILAIIFNIILMLLVVLALPVFGIIAHYTAQLILKKVLKNKLID